MADKCLACHTEVAAQLQARNGLHGRLVGEPASPTCRGCHTDHRGPRAALTVLDSSFAHDLTGYSLAGHQRSVNGAKVTCADCHPKGLTQFDQGVCSSCHTDT